MLTQKPQASPGLFCLGLKAIASGALWWALESQMRFLSLFSGPLLTCLGWGVHDAAGSLLLATGTLSEFLLSSLFQFSVLREKRCPAVVRECRAHTRVREVTSDCRRFYTRPVVLLLVADPGSWQPDSWCLVFNNTLVLPGNWLRSNVGSLFYTALGNVILKYPFACHMVNETRRLAEHRDLLILSSPLSWHNTARDPLLSVLFPSPTIRPSGPATPCDSQKHTAGSDPTSTAHTSLA